MNIKDLNDIIDIIDETILKARAKESEAEKAAESETQGWSDHDYAVKAQQKEYEEACQALEDSIAYNDLSLLDKAEEVMDTVLTKLLTGQIAFENGQEVLATMQAVATVHQLRKDQDA